MNDSYYNNKRTMKSTIAVMEKWTFTSAGEEFILKVKWQHSPNWYLIRSTTMCSEAQNPTIEGTISMIL